MAVTTTFSLETVLNEFQANFLAGFPQTLSHAVGLDGGGYAFICNTEGSSAATQTVQFAVYGTPNDSQPSFSTTLGTNIIGEPLVACLANGSIALIWKEGSDGGDNTIYSSVFDPQTNTFTAQDVSIASNAAFTDPEVTVFTDGFFGIVATDGTDVYFRFMNQDGTITGGFEPFVVGPGGSGSAIDPAIATLKDNGFVVTYKHGSNVEARIYDVNGNQQAPTEGIVVADVGTGGSAKVVGRSDGSFLVVYEDNSGTPGIFLRDFSSLGQGGDPIRVDVSLGQLDATDPQITILKSGNILVTYTNVLDDGAGGTDLDVIGRVFDSNGDAVTVDGAQTFVINNTSANDENQSSIARLLDGQFVTTWTDSSGDEDGTRISGLVQELVSVLTGDDDADTIAGTAARNIIHGGGGEDALRGVGGRDDVFGDAGNDGVQIVENELVNGAIYDGGDDTDTLHIFGTSSSIFDFRQSTVVNFETLNFASQLGGGATFFLTGTQFKQFSTVTYEAQDTGARVIEIDMGDETYLDLSTTGVAFTGSVANDDRVVVNGDGDNETIVASGLIDTIDAGAGNDGLQLFEELVQAGDTFRGGIGRDDLVIFGRGSSSLDFRSVDLSGFEELYLGNGAGGGVTMHFNAGQMLQFDTITFENTANGARVVAIDMGSTRSLNLSRLVIEGTPGKSDRFVVNGDGSSETIRGSKIADTINAAGGNDILLFASQAEFAGDVINGGTGTNSIRFTSTTANGTLTLSKLVTSVEIAEIASAAGNATGTTALNLNASAVTTGMALNGNEGNNKITGTAKADTISGRGGNDTISGGLGADKLSGGSGNDVFLFASQAEFTGDTINGGIGRDTIRFTSTVANSTLTLSAALTGIENAEIANAAGSTSGTTALNIDASAVKSGLSLTGNAGTNTIIGTNNTDSISDGGKGGSDTLRGNGGSDTYFISNSGAKIIEGANDGINDAVFATASYTLKAGVHVEKLLAFPGTTNAINLTGNILKQEITGNNTANILSDGGKGAADTMKGLGGNDTYKVFNSGDIIVEGSKEGTGDKVLTAVNYTLKAGVYVETLMTTDAKGKTALQLSGNDIKQTITGNAGANVLKGFGGGDTINGGDGDDRIHGGAGKDILNGGNGADRFYFDAALSSSSNVDRIEDFSAVDEIWLSSTIFSEAGAKGTLASSAFAANTTGLATDGNDRIIYEKDTGELYYDSNGNKSGGSFLIAILDKNLSLGNTDFLVF